MPDPDHDAPNRVDDCRGVIRVPRVHRGSLAFIRRDALSIPSELQFSAVVASPKRGAKIAQAYMEAPEFDPASLTAYRAFQEETKRQFDYLTSSYTHGGLGITVEVSTVDPYQNAIEMTRDLFYHDRLKIYATAGSGNEHPLLTNDENDMFRAVHDAFGHASIGRGFDRHGEEAAWLKHSFMYSRLARQAMTTETRGQNCTLIFHYGGRRFPRQKVALLPMGFCDPQSVTFRRQVGPMKATTFNVLCH